MQFVTNPKTKSEQSYRDYAALSFLLEGRGRCGVPVAVETKEDSEKQNVNERTIGEEERKSWAPSLLA